MQKPKNTIYGIRLLYASAIALTVIIGALIFNNDFGGFASPLAAAFAIPIIGWLYLIYLLSKGRFWVRSIFLALTIINGFRTLIGISDYVGILSLILLLLNAMALYFLYKKDSNAWFADHLMNENLKQMEKQRR